MGRTSAFRDVNTSSISSRLGKSFSTTRSFNDDIGLPPQPQSEIQRESTHVFGHLLRDKSLQLSEWLRNQLQPPAPHAKHSLGMVHHERPLLPTLGEMFSEGAESLSGACIKGGMSFTRCSPTCPYQTAAGWRLLGFDCGPYSMFPGERYPAVGRVMQTSERQRPFLNAPDRRDGADPEHGPHSTEPGNHRRG